MKPARKAWSELGWQVIGALVVVTAFAALYARGENTRGLSPCAENPRGDACAHQREAVARAEPIRNPCISNQRVTGHKGRNCPRFYLARRSETTSHATTSASTGLEGGDALQPGSTGHQPSGPRGGGDQGGGDPAGNADPPPASQGADRAPPPAGEDGALPAKPKTLPEQATDALEAVTGTVTDAADKATDDVGETVDEACQHLPQALCTK